MKIVTTDTIEGQPVKEYLGIVTGTDIYTVGGVFGGGFGSQEKLFDSAFSIATDHMVQKAENLGADAIVGVKITVLSAASGNQIIVVASGTAVKMQLGTGRPENARSVVDASANMSVTPKHKTCPSCGYENKGNAFYCDSCGARL